MVTKQRKNGAPLLMGILNTTPDSFSDGGRFGDFESAIAQARKLIKDGADIIDIGGESTRPGAKEIDIETEISRTIPIIKAIREFSDIQISIDTRKPQIAELAIAAGANIWNDVSALTFDDASLKTAVQLSVPVVLMHFQGLPENMQDKPFYRDVVGETLAFLAQRMGAAIACGVKRENIILDIGIGFGKTLEHNLELLSNFDTFNGLGCPILLGASRKSLIAAIDNTAIDPLDRLGGSIAIALWGAQKNASILRVHDVRETKQAILIQKAIKFQ